jgi:cytidine deaminase
MHLTLNLVGAAILLDNGQIILGSNQENAAYPSGLCAERVVIFMQDQCILMPK